MNQNEKVMAALTTLEAAHTAVEEHEAAVKKAQAEVDKATAETIRVFKATGLENVFFKGSFYALEKSVHGDDGEVDLDIEVFEGTVLS
jgi:hypothetical protein